MSRPEVLFVDDDPSGMLSGLREVLDWRRDSWETCWVRDGPSALNVLAEGEIDILVADARTVGAGGSSLLDQARRYYPTTARIVLWDPDDADAAAAASGPSQRLLSKPVDPQALVAALESTLAARALLDDTDVRALLGGVESLPRAPAIYTELAALSAQGGANAADVAQVIERDVATATEVLRLVNSSFFGVGRTVTSLSRAVSLLGLDAINALVLAAHLYGRSQAMPGGLDAAALAERGLLAGLALRRIGATEGWDGALTEQLSLAALLHDVGLLVLAAGNPGSWAAYRDSGQTSRVAQQAAFGCSIGQASAYLLGLWGFPDPVIHCLSEQPVDLDDQAGRLTASPAALAIAIARRESPHLEGAWNTRSSARTGA